jgi:hypothetical protein
MIDVNLLPHHLRPIKRTPLPYLAAFLVAGVALSVMGYMFVKSQAQIVSRNHELAGLMAQIKELEPIMQEAKRLEDQKQILATKIATIKEIVAGRIIWSRQLFNLGRLAPSNLWYSGFKVTQKQFKEVRKVIDKNTKQPKNESVMVSKPVLQVSGFVADTPNASSDVSSFALAAEQDSEFSDLFQLETSQLSDTEFAGSDVKSFTLEFRILSEGGSQ